MSVQVEEGDLFTDRSYTFRDPAEKQTEAWRVLWKGEVCTPTFNSKGAAEAYLDGLRAGRRPELRRG